MKRAFVIGNGPSLNRIDIKKLTSETTISFNRAYIAYEDWGFYPTYYMCVDGIVLENIKDDINRLIQTSPIKHFFLPDWIRPSIVESDKVTFIHLNPGQFFGTDVNNLSVLGNAGACSVQILNMLGYKQIVLVGVDCRYEESDLENVKIEQNPEDKVRRIVYKSSGDSDPNHFRADYFGAGCEYSKPQQQNHFRNWQYLANNAPYHGIQIISSSPDSTLNGTFPYIEYEFFFPVREKNVLTILDPSVISLETNLINELCDHGIDHLKPSPNAWNYVLDHVWMIRQIEQYLGNNPDRNLTILDVGCGGSKFHGFLEKKFGINILGIDREEKCRHYENVDYCANFLELDVFPPKSVDIIIWLSAIEHNEKEMIRRLFHKSMSLLKEGGLFLATCALSEHTCWFVDSEQTNLNIADCMELFELEEVDGDFHDIRKMYRDNTLLLRDRYEKRYQRFGPDDPQFIVGAISKIKTCKTTQDSNIQQNNPNTKYLFVPSNDTHVQWMFPFTKVLDELNFMVFTDRNERADYYLSKLNQKFFVYQQGILSKIKPSVIVFGNDWGGAEKKIIPEAKQLGIPTVCIQEGCLDFLDERTNRMLHADYAFLQGPVMRRYLRKDNNVLVTGNPKYDSLYEIPLPEKATVMINSNFTYGIFENARDQWVRDVVESCRESGLDFFISQHPRDKGIFPPDYPLIKSDAFRMRQQLQNTSILVSRFSTVIYEAVAMGREAVYYNPHGEPFRIFAQDDTGGIQIANDRSELIRAINQAIENLNKNRENRNKFLTQHCYTLSHDAVIRCAACLRAIAQKSTEELSLLSAVGEQQTAEFLDKSKKEKPIVSVIIPCYNTAEYLAEAIESVLKQTFDDFEIIVVDDGSTDNTDEVTNSFDDRRIHYVRHQKNKGLAAARNTGIKHSDGRYLTFLDADDYFLPDKLKNQVSFLDKYSVYGLISGMLLRIDEDGNVLKESNPKSRPVFPDDLLMRSRFGVHSTLIRRCWIERIGFFDESLRSAEDWDLHCRLAMHGCLMYRTNDIVGAYRMRCGSLSVDPTSQTENLIKVIDKVFANKAGQPKLAEIEALARGFTHLRAATFYYVADDVQNGRYHFGRALSYNPDFRKKNYDFAINLILRWIEHLSINSPDEYFDALFNNLPDEASDFQHLRRQIMQLAKSNRLLSTYKEKHCGQRCVIIGNGPSLKKMDMSFLKDEVTFGFDRIDIKIENHKFNPTYYICLNPLHVDQDTENILQMSSKRFLSPEIIPFIQDCENIVFLKKTNELSFVRDPQEGLGDGLITTYAALQLAYFMGFNEVILIGCDHNLINSDMNMLVEYSGENAGSNLTDLEKVKVAYEMAKVNFESDGRRIIDATFESKLDIFPKVEYQQIFFSKSYQNDTCQNYSDKQMEEVDFYVRNRTKLLDKREDNGNTDHIIRWRNLWDELKPDGINNLYFIACSYITLGKFDIALSLFEKVLKSLRNTIDSIDFSACSEFLSRSEMTECFVSTCTHLAQCYGKQKAWDKVNDIYSFLLKQQHLRLSELQKQDIRNILKKLEDSNISNASLENNISDASDPKIITSDASDTCDQIRRDQSQLQSCDIPEGQEQTHGALVSVIIPAYNGVDYIAKAIESVLVQNYRSFELLIINDGSTDNTEEIVAGFKDKRIRYFRQENQGLATTHNRGIKQSRGEFVIKLDVDDMMTPDFISRHLQEFEKHPEADLVYCDDHLIDEKGETIRVIKRPEYSDEKFLIRDMFRCGFPVVPFRTCIRKSVFETIGFFDESLSLGEDYDMMRRFVRQGLKIHHLREALYLRRMTGDSLSRNFTAQKAECLFEILGRFVDTFEYNELFPDVAWVMVTPERRSLNLKCLIAATYLGIGQAYLRQNSSFIYAKVAFEHVRSELNDCLKIDPNNRQAQLLLQTCELHRQKCGEQVQQAVL